MKKFYLALCAVLAISACASNTPKTEEQTSLRDAYKDVFHIGTALSKSQIMGWDLAAQKVSNKEFSAITAENSMKWEEIHPKEGQFNFTVADKLVELAEQNDQFVIGHTLLWHQQTPNWVFEDKNGNPASKE